MLVKMAMLAEPRRKKKIPLDPRGSNWTNDDNKFGQKLMEKMGWSKGKGLGANLDGRMEPVKASLRTDNRGVGCSKSYADNWIAHQDDFNALLANLGQDHGGGGNSSEEEAVKVSSLEEKSRTSKGRVHYHKFTKGKDLSLKSSSDLDCVFGKRKSQSESNTPLNQSEANSDASDTEEIPTSGLKTVKSSDSVQSYFAKKMAEKKAKLTGNYVKDDSHLESTIEEKTEDDMINGIEDRDEPISDVQVDQKEKKKSKKKSKKNKKAKEEKVDEEGIWFGGKNENDKVENDSDQADKNTDGKLTDDLVNVNCNDNENSDNARVKKKKKKNKKTKPEKVPDCEKVEATSENATNESKVDVQDESTDQVDEIIPKKKKKSKKSKNNDNGSIRIDIATDVASNEVRQDREKVQENGNECDKTDVDSLNIKSKKKNKKSKKRTETTSDMSVNHKDGDSELQESQTPASEMDQATPSKKRKIEKVDSGTKNAKETESEGKESDSKRRKNGSDDFLNYDCDSAFNGANLSQVKGYSGLTKRVVVNGLKRRYSKKFQQD